MRMIFDSHAHYDDKQFADDRDGLLSSMGANNIGFIVNVGSGIDSCRRTLELAEQYDFIHAAIGVHPSDIEDLNEESFAWLKQQSVEKHVSAIGEIGLDYYWDKEPEVQNRQRYWFQRQLKLAQEVGLPVIIHSRDAARDTMDILKNIRMSSGVIHCYSYSKEMALEYVEMGYYIGVGGVVTFKNAKKLKETVRAVPLERIVVETDCPYLAPEPYRGRRNSSLNLPYVIREIALLKGVLEEEVEDVTCENAKKLYGLK